MMMTYIYGLRDPRDGRIRYVGKSNKPKERLARHIREAKESTHTHKRAWIRGILNDGMRPEIILLMQVPHKDWKRVERALVRHLWDCDKGIVNVAVGGNGGVLAKFQSEETRRKRSESMKRKWQDEEWAAMVREAHAESKPQWTPEGLASFREKRKTWKPMLGKKLTEEHKAKIGAANAIALKGRPMPKEISDKGRETRWANPDAAKRQAKAMEKYRGPDGQFLPKDTEAAE